MQKIIANTSTEAELQKPVKIYIGQKYKGRYIKKERKH